VVSEPHASFAGAGKAGEGQEIVTGSSELVRTEQG
jgi:hypothetical protein